MHEQPRKRAAIADNRDLKNKKQPGQQPQQQHQQQRRTQATTTSTMETVTAAEHAQAQAQAQAESKDQCKRALSRMSISIISLLVLGILCGASIYISLSYIHEEESERRDEASDLAFETGRWFASELDRAILPLFSLAQFATELQIFKGLSQVIGPAGFPGSIGFMPSESPDGAITHRDVAGVCDEPTVKDRFIDVASTIKENAKMPGILVTLELLPQGVVCLIHPKNNTEDFEDGLFLDNTAAFGLDLMTDPRLRFQGGQTLKADDVLVVGPVTLRQCADCPPSVNKAFIARLPINIAGGRMVFEGVDYEKWGFAVAIINWNELLIRSGVYENFARKELNFRLTRTDTTFDPQMGIYEESEVILAESPGFDVHPAYKTVTVALDTVNNEWEMTVLYDKQKGPGMRAWLIPLCVIISILISSLVYTTLTQKQRHTEMQGMAMAQNAQVETERDMTAYFAHELRNPLGAIDSALIAMPNDLSPDATELIEGMRLCTNFMSSIMNNLLDARKLEEGKMSFHIQPIELGGVLSSIQKMLLPSIKPGVEFLIENNTGNRNWVLADYHRLQQIMTNVITNAMKYTTAGYVKLSFHWDANKNLVFQCVDTGPGIPKDEQKELFTKFVKRGGAPGTGLGLTIAKHLVDLIGGSIHFQSDPSLEPGTTCVVLLPLEECNGAEEAASKPQPDLPPIKAELSILIVDDIRINRVMLVRRMKKGIAPNATTHEAPTGEEALKLCQRIPFDVIVMDMYMSEAGGAMLGTDAVMAIRRMGLKSIIIGCSGNDLCEEFKRAGADLVWQKPLPNNAEIIRQFRVLGLRDASVLEAASNQ